MPEDLILDSHYLFPLHERGIKRYDELRIHNRAFKWEGIWRVMVLDTVTQEMILSQIGEVTYHKPQVSQFNWNNVTIEDMGTAGYRVMFRNTVLGSGFHTYEDAKEFVNRKKSGVQ